MRSLLLSLVVLFPTSAFAQQPQPPQSTPMEQALGAKLMEEINSNIQLRTQMVDLQNQIRDLKAKLTPDKPPEKK